MKYSAIILAFAAGVFALPQENSVTSAPASAASAALRPQESCVLSCDPADVTCQAQCLGIAHPNSSQAVANVQCAEKCDQGDGSKEDSDKFAQCLADCREAHFPTTQTIGNGVNPPAQTGAASNSAGATNNAGGSGSPAGTGAQQTGSGSPTGTAGESPQETGAASVKSVKLAGAGIAGFALAVFAL